MKRTEHLVMLMWPEQNVLKSTTYSGDLRRGKKPLWYGAPGVDPFL